MTPVGFPTVRSTTPPPLVEANQQQGTVKNQDLGDNKRSCPRSPSPPPKRPRWASPEAANVPARRPSSVSRSPQPDLLNDMAYWKNKLPNEKAINKAWGQVPRLADKRAIIEFAKKMIQPKLDELLSREEGPVVIHIGEVHGQAASVDMQEWVLTHVASKMENGKSRNLIYLNEVRAAGLEIYKRCGELNLKNRAELKNTFSGSRFDDAAFVAAIRLARINGFEVSSLEPTLPKELDPRNFSSILKCASAREEIMLRTLKSALLDKNAVIVSVGGGSHLPSLHGELRGNQMISIALLQKRAYAKNPGTTGFYFGSARSSLQNMSYLLTHPEVIKCCPEARILPDEEFERILQLPASARPFSLVDIQSLIHNALQENDYGPFDRSCLLPAFLREKTGQEAYQVARALDKTSTLYTGLYASREIENSHTRGNLLLRVLYTIGKTKSEVYEPFLERLRLPSYAFDTSTVSELREKFPNIPDFARDEICKALLNREDDDETLLSFAEEMFQVMDQLSPDVQDVVFERTKTFFEIRGPLTNDFDKEYLRDMYPVTFIEKVFRDQPEKRKAWIDLIEAACSA